MTDQGRAMTSRTISQLEGRNSGGNPQPLLAAPEQRRQDAVKRYRDGEPIERICQEMGCSKSWLYKWKKRYRFDEPDWSQTHSRRPETTPTKTPESLEAEIVRLYQTLSPGELGTVSAQRIRDHLAQPAGPSRPSIRTIYRILNRHTKEVSSHPIKS